MLHANRTPFIAILGLVISFVVETAPSALAQAPGFTPEEWAVVQTLSPLPPVPPDPTNRYADDPAAAVLGQRLFFETRYSGDVVNPDDGTNGGLGIVGERGRSSCAACHMGQGMVDDRSNPNNVSLGLRFQRRNTPTVVNVAYYDWHGWAGQQDRLWTQSSRSFESGRNTRGDRLSYAHMIWDYYRDEYNAIFDRQLPTALAPDAPDADRFPPRGKRGDDAWENMPEADKEEILWIMANTGKAIAAYERLLVRGNAPFDRFVGGDFTAISESAQRGLQLFIGKAGCITCHSGAIFSDQRFHNLGVPQQGPPDVPSLDDGRFADIPRALGHEFHGGTRFSDDPVAGMARQEGVMATEALRGAFKTISLRNITETAPYFHTGGMATLGEVVDFYNQGGGDSGFAGQRSPRLQPLNLSEGEKTDLVAFMETLTGELLSEDLVTDPHVRPELVQVMDGLGVTDAASGAIDTFISPLGEQSGLREFTIQLTEPADFSSAVVVLTGEEDDEGSQPSVMEFRADGGPGRYCVRFDQPLPIGQWAKITLNVTSTASQLAGRAVVWLAHHPADVNQDGRVDIRDATRFGHEFNGRQAAALIDLNGDGTVSIADSTAFGRIWRGEPPSTQIWRASTLPPRPQ